MSLNILCLGEIVGKPGIYCIKKGLKALKDEFQADFVMANGEGATGGFGIGKNHAIYLHKLGIDVITTGEKSFYKKDMVPHISKDPHMLRPANYPPGSPGRGWRIFPAGGKRLGVVSLLGQSGFRRTHLSNPFTFLPDIVSRLEKETDAIIVEFHAATTAEKYSFFHFADGKVSAVAGTHTKALTADEQILPGGTGIICDTGRTGSIGSVGGFDPKTEIDQLLTQIPERSNECWDSLEIQGVFLKIGDNGKTEEIKRFRIPLEDAPNERTGNSNEG